VPRVSVIVVAYHAGETLSRCLASLGDGTDVVVVDNGGDVADAGGANLVCPPENLGFAAGANLGAARASGDVLVFLNPDTVAGPGAIEALVRALEDPSVGIAMARLRLLADPELLNSSGNVIHVTGFAWAGGYRERADGLVQTREVPYASGAAMAVRAEVFRKLGGFRDDFFLYHEDVDLGWRARMRGYRVVVAPEADVFHDYEFARNVRKSYFLERNRLVFVFSAYSARLLLVLAPVLAAAELAVCLRALREGWLREKARGWLWCAKNARKMVRLRRETQRARRVRDRELARFLTPVLDPAMVSLSPLVRAANPLLVGYWALAKRAL
jgi:GT2 family glycosyltransferase